MASYNRVILVGNLTRDPELRYIASGTAVTDIGLAINDRIKRGDQWVEEVNFFYVTLWGRTAEIANEYLSKGSSVLIEGRLKQNRWEKDGQKHSRLEIVGDKMQMLGSRGGGSGGGGGGGHSRHDEGSTDHYSQPEPHQSQPEPPQPAEQFSSAGTPPTNPDIPF